MPKQILLCTLFALLLLTAGVSAQDSTYVVRYGDVLDTIAASFNLSADCIAQQNELANPNRLRPGDTLIINPNCPPYDGLIPLPPEVQAAAQADTADQGGGATTTRRTSSARGETYTVKRGDVLDTIAAAFDVSVRCLAAANELANPGRLRVGDELVIDTTCPPYDGLAPVPNPRADAQGLGQGGGARSYIVRVGDVLDRIAARVNLDTACLAEANNLANPGRIFPGDEILIDPGCPPYAGLDPLNASESD
jgi:lysozyme